MDTRLYRVRLNCWVTPRINPDSPEITVYFNQEIVYRGPLNESRCFSIDQQLPQGSNTFEIEFTNKQDSDTDVSLGLDKAVMIDRVQFNDIDSPRFVWAGVYKPTYPEPWFSEQTDLGTAPELLLKSHTYLGWNGKWTLTFDTPIFTWIHNLEDLGWIYG